MDKWGQTFEYWVWQVSYQNIQMLMSALPDTGASFDKDEQQQAPKGDPVGDRHAALRSFAESCD